MVRWGSVGLGHTLWLDIGDARPQSDWGTTSACKRILLDVLEYGLRDRGVAGNKY